MKAPNRFVEWMSEHTANDRKFGRTVFRYHPRSDEHSKMLCQFILDDLIAASPELAKQIDQGFVVGGVNLPFRFPNGKEKTLDLAVGRPKKHSNGALFPARHGAQEIVDVRISCEAKQCMTEHSKTKPRIFDELSSSHEIVHQGDTRAIAAGIVVINISAEYASPTRQVSGEGDLLISRHQQPRATESMVTHLRGLLIRESIGEVGFDAFCTMVIECDNTGGPCLLHTGLPAPQFGDPDHYETFISRIAAAYAERFGK